jgi:ribose transport system ATP-binding protein
MWVLENVTKVFPGVVALDSVSVAFRPGEVHGLMGENGAGKSTLMKVMTGIYQADGGQILVDGNRVHLGGQRDAAALGIHMVNQEIQVVPEASVGESVCLNRLSDYRVGGFLRWKALEQDARAALDQVGLSLDPRRRIGDLTAAEKQLIEIAKALSSKSSFLLFDEPTSSLSAAESENLFRIIDELRSSGIGVIFVSHKIDEVMRICDRVSVLRDGKWVGELTREEMSPDAIVSLMIGRSGLDHDLGRLPEPGEVALSVEHLSTLGQFEDVSFSIRSGEILGWYGLVGSGRTELARQVVGADPRDAGTVTVKGRVTRARGLREMLERHRVGYVTENRKEEGLVLEDDIAENLSLTVFGRLRGRVGLFSPRRQHAFAQEQVQTLSIKTPSLQTKVSSLSGGNQQKVSIGKWLAADCDVLFLDEPTVGVDVGAKESIHSLIWSLAADQGKAVVVISSDLAEMVKLARRILVFRDQRIVGEIDDLNDGDHSYERVSKLIGDLLG